MNSGMASSLRARACCLALLDLPAWHGVCHGVRRGFPRTLDRSAQPDPVAAGVFGPVQREVGRGQQFEQVTTVAAEDGNADRDRDLDLHLPGADLQHAGTVPKPFRDPACLGGPDVRQQDGELLPPEPAYHVPLADLAPQLGTPTAENPVPAE